MNKKCALLEISSRKSPTLSLLERYFSHFSFDEEKRMFITIVYTDFRIDLSIWFALCSLCFLHIHRHSKKCAATPEKQKLNQHFFMIWSDNRSNRFKSTKNNNEVQQCIVANTAHAGDIIYLQCSFNTERAHTPVYLLLSSCSFAHTRFVFYKIGEYRLFCSSSLFWLTYDFRWHIGCHANSFQKHGVESPYGKAAFCIVTIYILFGGRTGSSSNVCIHIVLQFGYLFSRFRMILAFVAQQKKRSIESNISFVRSHPYLHFFASIVART